jgi:hypothetical protein
MRQNMAAICGVSMAFLLLASVQAQTQEIHAWYYARFLSTEGRIEVCPAGEQGLVVVHSKRPDHCLAESLPSKDSDGHAWTGKDYVRFTFRYSAEDRHFKLERYDYRKLALLPDWRSWDYGHSIDLNNVVSPYIGNLTQSPLPRGSRVKWVDRLELNKQWFTVIVWEPNEATQLNIWIVATNGKNCKVVAQLPTLDGESFQGVQITDCLDQGNWDLILYAQSHGAHCTFPEAYLMRVSSLEKQPEYFFTYNDDPSNWLEKTRYHDLSAPPNGK